LNRTGRRTVMIAALAIISVTERRVRMKEAGN
jgi:hypothetical protein